MKKILLASALTLAAIPTAAWADDYGSPGQLEAGGVFGIISETETYKPDGGTETKTSLTGVIIQPQVGYFVSNGLELIGELNVGTFSSKVEDADPTTSTAIGLGVGGGYFLKIAGMRIGPQAILRFSQTSTTLPDFVPGEDLKFTQQDVGGQVGGFAKMPIGGGGVLAAGLAIDYASVSQTIELGAAELEPTGANSTIGVRVGYFVFF